MLSSSKKALEQKLAMAKRPCFGIITVAEMWDANSGQKWRLVVDPLPNVVLKKIAGLEIQLGEGTDDQLVWDGAFHGGFSFKAVISIIRTDTQE